MWKDSETKIDFLDFGYLKESILDIIRNKDLSPSSIGVYGNWGSGKSSLMQMCIDDLSNKENILCVKFNGWLFEGYEDTKTAFIGTILDKINESKSPTGNALSLLKRLYKNTDKLKLAGMGIKYGIDFLVTGGVGTLADITMNSVLSKLKDKATEIDSSDIENFLKDEFRSEELRKDIKSFQNDFKELLSETKIEKLVVFVDELDRCNPDTILETLEAIRLFLFTKNTSFVIGADERHVIYSVRKKYSEIEGNQIDIGKEYLEKMIQYPIRIPQLSSREVEFYILCLFLQIELTSEEFDLFNKYIIDAKKKDFFNFELTFENLNNEMPEIANKSRETISLAKQLSSVLSTGLNGNPRHCKRFLNSLAMREKMSISREIKMERKILAKLMLLEYFKADFFKKLSKLQSYEKGKPSALCLIEENKWEEAEELKLWKDDPWINNWMEIEPHISDVDLRPYFYFSRESLTSQLNIGQYRLSNTAEKVLSDLLSGADSQRNAALKLSEDINDSEASLILEKLSDKILTETNIEINIFRSLLEWGASKELLFTNTISCLNELPGNKINFSMIPRIKSFMDKTLKIQEVTDIVKRWEKENPKLEPAIKKILER
ncbi:MAG: P-loop NTPase fold protein [Thermodesulfobacteriota bacterium]|nr:P-loop NTPase fold protein [Thermodesulfobacteriota bacterium]